MKNKYLHTFNVPRIEEVEVVEKRMEDGQEIKITKREKKVVERKYGILSPKRSKLEEGEMYYAARVSENIKNGIMPTSILIRKFDEQGGFLSDSEMKYQNSMREEALEINRKIDDISKESKASLNEQFKLESEKKLEILIDRYYDIQEELLKIQQSIDTFFEQSAEIKARNRTIVWWILNICYDLNDGKEEHFFKGKTLEEKLNSLDDLEESEEEFIGYLIKKLSYFVSYWYSSRINKEEQFNEIEKNFRLISGVKEYERKIKEVLEKDAKTADVIKAADTTDAAKTVKVPEAEKTATVEVAPVDPVNSEAEKKT